MPGVNDQIDPEEWSAFVREHRVGEVMAGKVAGLAGFGAYIELAPGIWGVLHDSDWGAPMPLGFEVRVRLAAVDSPGRRLLVRLARED